MADTNDGSESEARRDGPADELPEPVVDRVETLTRRARRAADPGEREAYLRERSTLLADHGYSARVREGDASETLVLYPDEWLDGGVAQLDRIEDTDRAAELSLSGPGDSDWDAVEAHNRAVAERVCDEHGDVHGANAHAFADFMSNHYAKPIERATHTERAEFRTEYFLRNAWPTDDQRAIVEQSLRLIVETAESM